MVKKNKLEYLNEEDDLSESSVSSLIYALPQGVYPRVRGALWRHFLRSKQIQDQSLKKNRDIAVLETSDITDSAILETL